MLSCDISAPELVFINALANGGTLQEAVEVALSNNDASEKEALNTASSAHTPPLNLVQLSAKLLRMGVFMALSTIQTNSATHTVSNSPYSLAFQAWRAAPAGAAPHSVKALLARIAMGNIFWLSARTKVKGLLTLKDSTFFLFENEYALPVLRVNVAACLATYSAHLFALMLFVGLGSRLGVAGMLAITAVIQLLVYPSAWPTHLGWALLLLVIIAQGPGRLSLDHVLFGRR